MTSTPATLLERLRQPGDEEAWRQFVDLYTPLLFHWAKRAKLADQDAADLVQEVFVILVRKLPEFVYDRNRGFRLWLRKVLLNKWRERCRGQIHAARNLLPDEADNLADDPVAEFWEDEYRRYLVGRARELMKDEVEPATWTAFWKVTIDEVPVEVVAAELD